MESSVPPPWAQPWWAAISIRAGSPCPGTAALVLQGAAGGPQAGASELPGVNAADTVGTEIARMARSYSGNARDPTPRTSGPCPRSNTTYERAMPATQHHVRAGHARDPTPRTSGPCPRPNTAYERAMPTTQHRVRAGHARDPTPRTSGPCPRSNTTYERAMPATQHHVRAGHARDQHARWPVNSSCQTQPIGYG